MIFMSIFDKKVRTLGITFAMTKSPLSWASVKPYAILR